MRFLSFYINSSFLCLFGFVINSFAEIQQISFTNNIEKFEIVLHNFAFLIFFFYVCFFGM